MIEDETDVLDTWYAEAAVRNEYDYTEYGYFDNDEEEEEYVEGLMSNELEGDLYVDPLALANPDDDQEDWENAQREQFAEEEAELMHSDIPRELPAIAGYKDPRILVIS
jgi:hypothetical protein